MAESSADAPTDRERDEAIELVQSGAVTVCPGCGVTITRRRPPQCERSDRFSVCESSQWIVPQAKSPVVRRTGPRYRQDPTRSQRVRPPARKGTAAPPVRQHDFRPARRISRLNELPPRRPDASACTGGRRDCVFRSRSCLVRILKSRNSARLLSSGRSWRYTITAPPQLVQPQGRTSVTNLLFSGVTLATLYKRRFL